MPRSSYMHHPNLLCDSPSAIDTSAILRAATPGPEERLSHTIKSLFTLADVAARRRASRNFRKLTVNTDENQLNAGSSPSANLRRSKSSGDVAVLGEKTRALNVTPAANSSKKDSVSKMGKCSRGRSATTTSSTSPSKIPKAKSATSPNIDSPCPSSVEEDDWSPPAVAFDIPRPEELSVIDNALFVMLTPQTPSKPTKNLTLAAHVPSLPKVASPFSPRNSLSWPREQTRPSARSSPGTGHTSASLNLTKSHWELRYEAWIRSLRTHRRPRSAQSVARPSSIMEEPLPRSRFPDPPTNPALFPRAGMLTPKALRHYSMTSDEESRSTLELDWALRAWPMDKIQRTLFVHDMDVRVWFPVTSPLTSGKIRADHSDLDQEVASLKNIEMEKDRTMRRWEWDWELRWRVVESMVEDENDKDGAECEYDVFLAENYDGDRAYGGCEIEAERRTETKGDEWEWSEDAMEIDSV